MQFAATIAVDRFAFTRRASARLCSALQIAQFFWKFRLAPYVSVPISPICREIGFRGAAMAAPQLAKLILVHGESSLVMMFRTSSTAVGGARGQYAVQRHRRKAAMGAVPKLGWQ